MKTIHFCDTRGLDGAWRTGAGGAPRGGQILIARKGAVKGRGQWSSGGGIASPPGQLQLPRGRQAAARQRRNRIGGQRRRSAAVTAAEATAAAGATVAAAGVGDCYSNVGSGSAGTATATAAAATVVSVAAPPAVAWVRRASHRAPGFAPRHAASCCEPRPPRALRVGRPCLLREATPGAASRKGLLWVLAGYRRSLGRASAVAAGWHGQPARDRVHTFGAQMWCTRTRRTSSTPQHTACTCTAVCACAMRIHICARYTPTYTSLPAREPTPEPARGGGPGGGRGGGRGGPRYLPASRCFVGGG